MAVYVDKCFRAVLTWDDIDRLSNALTAVESGDVEAAEIFGTNGNGGESDAE